MKKVLIATWLFFRIVITVHAQYDSLLHQPSARRYQMLFSYYNDSIIRSDSASLFKKINDIKALAEKNGDEGLLTETDLMLVYYYEARSRQQPQRAETLFDKIQTALTKNPDEHLQMRLSIVEGSWTWDVRKNYEQAFEQWYKALQLFKKLNESGSSLLSVLQRVSESHYFFRDYRQAIFYLKQELDVIPQSGFDGFYYRRQITNTLGLCYQQLNNLDSSDYYFNLCRQYATSENNIDWVCIAGGNLGNNLYLRGRYNEALPLLREDVAKSIARQDWGCASGSQMVMAAISLKQNNVAAASVLLDSARLYVYRSGQYQRRQVLYPLLAKLYAGLNNLPLSALFIDSAMFVKDSMDNNLNRLIAIRAEQKLDIEQYRAQVEQVNSQKKLNMLERDVLIGIVVLMMAGAILLYRRQNKRKLQREQEYKKAQEDLETASRQLTDFAKNIAEKNNLIELLQQKGGDTGESLLQLQQSTILTDADWEYFRQLFEKVHSGFLQRLKQKIPGLTPAETRFMALNKLQLSNKEMAAMLGVGTDTIRQYRSRLRKKLNLAEEANLEEMTAAI